jgi:hypothetical protein
MEPTFVIAVDALLEKLGSSPVEHLQAKGISSTDCDELLPVNGVRHWLVAQCREGQP